MGTVGNLLKRKEGEVVSIAPDRTVLEAARLMDNHHIGALVVTGQSGEVVGIFTERDLMRRVVVKDRHPGETPISEVMTTTVACCSPETTLDELRSLMRHKRIRHVPVIEAKKVVGMVSIGDLNIIHDQTQEETIQYLEQYMYRP